MLTIKPLCSSLMLVRTCIKPCILGFSTRQTKNFQMSKLGLEKEGEVEIKLPTFTGLWREQGEFQKKHILLFHEITRCQEIKRCLLLSRKAMTSLDSILRSRDITLPARIVKAMFLPGVMYGCRNWTIKKATC